MPSAVQKGENRGRLSLWVYNLRHMRRWEKIFCGFLMGFVVAASTSKNPTAFLDSFFMVFAYTTWLLISLPSLYKKLTPRFVKTLLNAVVQVFFADLLIFGMYRYLKRHVTQTDLIFDAAEQRVIIFIMNGIRLSFIVFCLVRSFPRGQRKGVQTPVKRNTRSRKESTGRANSKSPSRPVKEERVWWLW